MPELATTVRQRRKELGLTQTQLAERADVTQNAVSMIETGRSGGWAKTRRALERALGLPDGALNDNGSTS